jgi:hypothetical protein
VAGLPTRAHAGYGPLDAVAMTSMFFHHGEEYQGAKGGDARDGF